MSHILSSMNTLSDAIHAPLHNLIARASAIYAAHFSQNTSFERAIFLSWYCSKGDCTFCFMSTQKHKIAVPAMAKRRPESLVTEALLCRELGWNIEFLSAGYGAYRYDELLRVIRFIYAAYTKKMWLNIGTLNEKQLQDYAPYIEGVSGSVETLDPKLHDTVCPSKPLGPIIQTLDAAKARGYKTGITIIIGLGEDITHFLLLKKFIMQHQIDRITFYRLNPHEGTPFTEGPASDYYARWIALTRIAFPAIEIIAGSWVDRVDEIHLLLQAGANNITKFPSTSMFNSSFARRIEKEVRLGGRILQGTMTKLPAKDWNAIIDELDPVIFDSARKEKIKKRMQSYLKMMMRVKPNSIESSDVLC